MEQHGLNSRLRLMQHSDMKGKIVLVRVDHNVVKRGIIKDPYRIDATLGTFKAIMEKGGRPIVMSHVGRPKDKKTGKINCDETESTGPIAQYLEKKLSIKIHIPEFQIDPERGLLHIEESIKPALEDLKKGIIDMIYLPNTRWFHGEQSKGPEKETFAQELSELAGVFVNDAFGSWQSHVSTYDIAAKLPSYAGILLQKEIMNLHHVFHPERPFVGVIAGAKYDTKIGPLKALFKKVDHLILGGLLYNTFLSAKYGIQISGVSHEDRSLANELVALDQSDNKILEMSCLVESDILDSKIDGSFRTIETETFNKGDSFHYILDIDPKSLEDKRLRHTIASAKTIFVNAVMGLTPHFFEGSQALYRLINSNKSAMKLFGGGDTLQELKQLCKDDYISGLDAPKTYYFTGGGSVLASIEKGSPYDLKPIQALMDN